MTKNQDPELAVLALADFAEKFESDGAEAYLIVNKNMQDYPCMFGFTKLSEDFAATQKLFEKVEAKARELGHKQIVGPLNYTTWLSYRWAIDHPEIKLYPDCNNPLFYVDQVKRLGYRELYTYRSATIKLNNALYEYGKQAYQERLKDGYEFKLISGNPSKKQIKEIYEISTAAFVNGPLYSELPAQFFEQIYLQWMKRVQPIAYVAYRDGCAVGFVMGYMSPYKNEFISKTSAILPEYQHKGIYAALAYLGFEHVKNLGLNEIVFHFQCEQRSTFQRFSNDIESQEKHYAIFIKDL